MTSPRPLLPYFVWPAVPLLVPLVAMRFTDEVRWSPFDFVIAYALFVSAGLAYRVATRRATSRSYLLGAALTVAGCLALVWVNLAVGFIGDEDNPANLLYGGVIALALIGGVISDFSARGMARTLFAMAGWQFLVPILAWFLWRANFDADAARIFLLNGLWVGVFLLAGWIFRRPAIPAP